MVLRLCLLTPAKNQVSGLNAFAPIIFSDLVSSPDGSGNDVLAGIGVFAVAQMPVLPARHYTIPFCRYLPMLLPAPAPAAALHGLQRT